MVLLQQVKKTDLWCFIGGNKKNQRFDCFNYELDSAFSTGLNSDTAREVKGSLGSRCSTRRN